MSGRMGPLYAWQPVVPVEYQSGGRQIDRSILMGIGRANQLDTYLSPVEYKGPQITFLSMRERMTGMAGGRISFQSMLQGAFSYVENPASTANELGGRLAYDAGWHYVWHPLVPFRLRAGALVGTDVGFLYNTRNGNNPAQARASLDVSLSAGGSYDFRVAHLPMQVLYQVDMPVIGCMFSPNYGQSYYEIYQGYGDHNVCFTSPANALSVRQLLCVDLCFSRTTLRVGYLSDIRQSHVNGIRMHDISRSFMLGYVRHFQTLKRKK
ncbi:MAG: DUF3316 domain-containing protein [Bacteroidaceae bacterium]